MPRQKRANQRKSRLNRHRTGLASVPAVSQLASPFASGSGGPNFENQVQTAFVVLMLTGGVAPTLPPWPITSIRLQGKHKGFATDDFITFVENGGRFAKFLGQIKYGAAITEGNKDFGDAIAAAYADFRNHRAFDPALDSLAIITGPLTATDSEARILLDWARSEATAKDFFDKVKLARFSNSAKRAKLQAFKAQLKKSNGGNALPDDEVWRFLRSYHILGYDLDVRAGVALSLLHSHVAQFDCGDIAAAWAEVDREVAFLNQTGGVVTRETLSRSVREKFTVKSTRAQMPEDMRTATNTVARFLTGDTGVALMIASLVGAWNSRLKGDMDAIRKLID